VAACLKERLLCGQDRDVTCACSSLVREGGLCPENAVKSTSAKCTLLKCTDVHSQSEGWVSRLYIIAIPH
jgi:hypothetical protein